MTSRSPTFVTAADLKHALEARDGPALANLYADDAELRVVDRNNPPSQPLTLRGRSQIAAFMDDICRREMTHEVEFTASEGDHIAFSETCLYPDGMKVLALSTVLLGPSGIERQTLMQAWDP